ncbi:MAG: hemolysin family protein [Bacteroidales bacterium]
MKIILILILVLINGFFAMSEAALLSARRSRISADAKKGSSAAKRALALKEKPSRFLSTVQIGITLIGILIGMFSGDELSIDLGHVLEIWGMNAPAALLLGQILVVILITLFAIIFGELVPKRIAISSAEKISKGTSGFMIVLSWIMSPFVYILSKTTDLIVKLFKIKDSDSGVTEDEIRQMVNEGREGGEVQDVEQDILERVFSLGDRKIESIMSPRNELIWIDKKMTNDEINDLVQANLYEVYPVADGNLDEIIGVVYLKDLFGKLDKKGFYIKDIIREAVYFHENFDVYKVMEQMKTEQINYGLICDEFGVCQGIVTYKDILEGLIGSVEDEEDDPDIIIRPSGGWLVNGKCSFYDFLDYYDIEEPEEADYTTVAGLALEYLEHFPNPGDFIDYEGYRLEIVDMDGTRIDKILVTKLEPNKFPDENSKEDEK